MHLNSVFRCHYIQCLSVFFVNFLHLLSVTPCSILLYEVMPLDEKKNSDARIRANNKYNAKAYDRINIAVSKGKKEIISTHAKERGESVNAFINRAIDHTMEDDNGTPDE